MWTIWNGEPMKKEEIRELEQIAEAFAPSVEQIADGLYDHPEIKYEEFFAYKTYTDYLKRQGMTVTEHVADIATAFVASYKQGEKGPCIALLAEYDALPNLGHGCGHNLLGAASLLAFETTVRYMKEKNIPGEIRLYGCPAEEGGAGKSRMVKAGVFTGVREELRPCHRLEKLLYENMCQATPISYTEEERLQAAEIAKQNPYNTLEDLLVKCDRYPDGGAMKAMLTAHMQDVIYDFVLPYMPDDTPHYYSTDVGDVSGICDTAQFAGCTWAANTMEHTKAVVAQGKSSIAHKGLRFAAGVLAATAVDCLRRTE